MNFPSKLLEEAVNEIAKLPGIGKKTALRLAMFLLKEDESATRGLSEALINLRTKIKYCRQCHHISDEDLCLVCSDRSRDESQICVVEDSRDVSAIESTSQYRGRYHVLGGLISPVNGVGPSDLHIDSLISRLENPEVKEIILALSATMESDTTAFYVSKKIADKNLKISTIARGIPVGGELEFTDELTLGRSILQRVNYD